MAAFKAATPSRRAFLLLPSRPAPLGRHQGRFYGQICSYPHGAGPGPLRPSGWTYRSPVEGRPPRPRCFSATAIRPHNALTPPKAGEELYVTFVDREGAEHKFAVAAGDNLLDIAQANDLEMEGACGGSCACSTCHVIVLDDDKYDKMPEPEDDENDMLDLAFGLTETSRLGCQVVMKKELDGLRVELPSMTRNMQASDFK